MEAFTPMSMTRSRWLLPALSACTAVAMFVSPIAWADDDKGGRGGGGDRGRGRGDDEGRVTVQVQSPVQTVVQRRDDDDENENENENRVVVSAAPLVNAVNNEVAALMNLNVDEEEDEDVDEEIEVEDVNVVNLAGLEAGLTADQAALVTAAVNANAGALRVFLAGTSPTAVVLSAALRNAGVDPTTVLAVLVSGEHEVTAVTG